MGNIVRTSNREATATKPRAFAWSPYPHCVEWFILVWLWMTLVERVARTRVKLAYEKLSGEGRHLTELDFRTLKNTDADLGIHAM